jgi:hypothetical protein
MCRLPTTIDSDSHTIAPFLPARLPQSHVSCACHTGVIVGSLSGPYARGRTGKMLWWGWKGLRMGICLGLTDTKRVWFEQSVKGGHFHLMKVEGYQSCRGKGVGSEWLTIIG